ncbi:DUF4180 domain-containing protein [Deinococcus sp. HMF7620]|uniref:DUF4180 domain-containing protein n=1 Tax=Deinococcus arboris TaxID=2682977 RepID=A0A7C9HUJ0_9DEIO|nr:DUF4180 domain-containing protein [Deinococcus arboris]MVN89067.1 DUF4180 domain-containing protein [Deinococcus arboris]
MKADVYIRTAAELGLTFRDASDTAQVLGAIYGLDGLILSVADLSPEFLNLRTGLLGELFQTFVNWRLPVAVVVPDPAAHGERFAELAREHARHPSIRFVPTEVQGRQWLETQTG